MSTTRKAFAVLAILALLAGTVSLGGAQSTQAQIRTVWGVVQGASPTADIEDVYMIDAHTAYAVGGDGNHGIAYRLTWDGARWNVALSGVFNSWLKAVVAISDDNVWAVGDQGLVLHKSGGRWDTPFDIPRLAYFNTIQMFGDGEEGWAAGVLRSNPYNPSGQPLMMHYKNGQWTQDTSVGTQGYINALHFTQGGGWAAGTGIWHYNGTSWVRENPPSPCANAKCTSAFSAVRAIGTQEAWFAGWRQENCPKCKPTVYTLHRTIGGWQRSLPEAGLTNWAPSNSNTYSLKGLAFYGNNYGLAVGVALEDAAHPLILTYRNGRWSRDDLPMPYGDLNNISLRDDSHALAVGYNGLILSWGYGGPQPQPQPTATATPVPPGPTPTPIPIPEPVKRVTDPHSPNVTYFPLVGHTLRAVFADYWQAHGGLEQFGYPLTEEFIEVSPTNGRAYLTQYFERARFEWHPENLPPNDVLLGLLGRTITQGRESEQVFQRATAEQGRAGSIYFDATGHNMASQFVGYWQAHGGLPVYGYPISEPFVELSPTDGRPYLVQYFERNRLEYHPELPEAFRVSLGLLGAQVLKGRGWIR